MQPSVRSVAISMFIMALMSFTAPVRSQDQESLDKRCIEGLPCSVDKYYPLKSTSMNMTKDLRNVKLEEFVTQGDFLIVTNGYTLEMKIARRLEINGVLTIRSFPTSDAPSTAQPGLDGQDSKVTFNSGPNTDGPSPCDYCPGSALECFACPGGAGGKGGPGFSGNPGVHGKAGGQVRLEFGDDPGFSGSGTIRILLRGQDGGKGGTGGNGGRGGHGEQGGKGFPSPRGGCSQDAQRGGDGGSGGDAGKGGPGGNAGSGGLIVIVNWPKTSSLQVQDLDVTPGNSGEGGTPGKPGAPGERGLGGQGFKGCAAAPPEKAGVSGKPGEPSTAADIEKMRGVPGQVGQPGNVFRFP